MCDVSLTVISEFQIREIFQSLDDNSKSFDLLKRVIRDNYEDSVSKFTFDLLTSNSSNSTNLESIVSLGTGPVLTDEMYETIDNLHSGLRGMNFKDYAVVAMNIDIPNEDVVLWDISSSLERLLGIYKGDEFVEFGSVDCRPYTDIYSDCNDFRCAIVERIIRPMLGEDSFDCVLMTKCVEGGLYLFLA